MSRKKRDGSDRLEPFVPLFRGTSESPAYRQLSFGARALFMALSGHCGKNNNGHTYLSQRDAEEELGHKNRNDIANWYRELVHYGFIVQTGAASLGVDGKGKAPHWRLTDRPTRTADGQLNLATKDFLHWGGQVFKPHVPPSRRWTTRKAAALKKQNPGLHVATTVDCTSQPVADCTSQPPNGGSGTNVQSISVDRGGEHVQPITSLATGGARSGPAGQGAVADTTEPGAPAPRHQVPIDLEDMGDDGDEPGMIQIEDVDGNLIWIPDQNDEQRETA
jgi:hypothetical protein